MKKITTVFAAFLFVSWQLAAQTNTATPATTEPKQEQPKPKVPPQRPGGGQKKAPPAPVTPPEAVTQAQIADFPNNAAKKWRKVNQFQFDTEFGLPSDSVNMDGDNITYYAAQLASDSGQDDLAVYDGTGKLIRFAHWLSDGDVPPSLKAVFSSNYKKYTPRKLRSVSETNTSETPLFYLAVLQGEEGSKSLTIGPDGTVLKERSHQRPGMEKPTDTKPDTEEKAGKNRKKN